MGFLYFIGGMSSVVEKSAPWRPVKDAKFSRSKVEKEIEAIVKEKVGDKPYDSQSAMQTSKELSTEIQERVKTLGHVRYKLVVQTFIAENTNQGLRVSSRCLWDPETDGFAEFTFTTETMHVTALVFGLY